MTVSFEMKKKGSKRNKNKKEERWEEQAQSPPKALEATQPPKTQDKTHTAKTNQTQEEEMNKKKKKQKEQIKRKKKGKKNKGDKTNTYQNRVLEAFFHEPKAFNGGRVIFTWKKLPKKTNFGKRFFVSKFGLFLVPNTGSRRFWTQKGRTIRAWFPYIYIYIYNVCVCVKRRVKKRTKKTKGDTEISKNTTFRLLERTQKHTKRKIKQTKTMRV